MALHTFYRIICLCTFKYSPYLDKRAHVGKVRVHGASVGKILVHPLHQLSEAAECHDLWEAHTNMDKQVGHCINTTMSGSQCNTLVLFTVYNLTPTLNYHQ